MDVSAFEKKFPEAYYTLKEAWESNQEATWRKLKNEGRITDSYCRFVVASPEYILKFYFSLVYDDGRNIPNDVDQMMRILEIDAALIFMKFIGMYIDQNPSFDIEPGQDEVYASLEAPVIKLDNVVGFFLQTHVFARASQVA